jgi:hypothetical protein
VPTATAVFGAWQHCIIPVWGGLEVVTEPVQPDQLPGRNCRNSRYGDTRCWFDVGKRVYRRLLNHLKEPNT